MFNLARKNAHTFVQFIFLIFAVGFCATSSASLLEISNDFLDPASAFKFSATEQPGEINIHFKIAEGYYMYRERFSFSVKNASAVLGTPQMPKGNVLFDETFNKDVETYRGDLSIRLPVEHATGPFDLSVISQGCAQAGVCYPPAEHIYRVDGAALHLRTVSTVTSPTQQQTNQVAWYERVTNADYAQSLLEGGDFGAIIGLYFIAGLVLSLLPCSYPMFPILSSIIVGDRAKGVRSFLLSLSYVLGMALVYTAFGVAAALIGQSLGAWLQNPWVLGAFAVLLTVLAIALIAGFDIALPRRWQEGATNASNRRSGGKFAAVAVMGALSALVVGACMTAPLFAVLAFIAHTGNAVLGAAALFSMAIGLGVPLLVIGVGAGALLPKAGAWMDEVKQCFGIILLAAALWIVWPVLGPVAQMLLSALWLLFAAAVLGLFTPHLGASSIWRRLGRGIGAVCAIWAVALLVGLAAGSSDPLRPLAVLATRASTSVTTQQQTTPVFTAVRSSEELDHILKTSTRPVLLDFYADWCVSCKEMDRFTFTDSRVRAELARFDLLRADVTANHADDQALLKRFKLFGPPGMIFFDQHGHETMRVVGYESANTFLRSLNRAVTAQSSQS